MLIEPLLQLLAKLKLHGMLGALQRQLSDPDVSALRFEERLNLLQHELAERDNYRLTQRLRVAALPQPACLDDLDNRLPRNLDPALLATVRDLGWIGRHCAASPPNKSSRTPLVRHRVIQRQSVRRVRLDGRFKRQPARGRWADRASVKHTKVPSCCASSTRGCGISVPPYLIRQTRPGRLTIDQS